MKSICFRELAKQAKKDGKPELITFYLKQQARKMQKTPVTSRSQG